MTKTERKLQTLQRKVKELAEQGIKLSRRQQEIYENLQKSSENRGKYLTADYLLKTLPTTKTETARRNLEETISRAKRQGRNLTPKQQKQYEKILSNPEQRGKATAIKTLEQSIKQNKVSVKQTRTLKTKSKTTALANLKRKRTRMLKAGFELNQVDQINSILLNPENFTVSEIQQVTKSLTGTAAGREFTPEEITEYLNVYQRMNRKGKEKSGLNSEFNKKRLREDKSLSNKAFITEMRIKTSSRYHDMREKQFLYNLLSAIERQEGKLQQDLFQRVIDVYNKQGQKGLVAYFENMQKTNETLFAALFAYGDGINLNIREKAVRDELNLPQGQSTNLTLDKVAERINTSDQQAERRKFLQQADKAGLNLNLI